MTTDQKRKLIEFNQLSIASQRAEIAFHQAKIALLEWRMHEDKIRLQLILMKPTTHKRS